MKEFWGKKKKEIEGGVENQNVLITSNKNRCILRVHSMHSIIMLIYMVLLKEEVNYMLSLSVSTFLKTKTFWTKISLWKIIHWIEYKLFLMSQGYYY